MLISIQHVNSEIGTIQPVEKIAQIAKQYDIAYHVDCVQSFCKLDVKSFSQEVDAITISAHKVGGPKGCGAVFINPKRRVLPVFPGVTHERGLRGGTVDTPAIIAFSIAVEQFQYRIEKFWSYRLKLKEMLIDSPFSFIEGKVNEQLPSIVGICLKGVEGQYVMLRLNEDEICISTGSACDINSASGTKAILAMGHNFSKARQFFRISFGMDTDEQEIEILGDTLLKLVEELNL